MSKDQLEFKYMTENYQNKGFHYLQGGYTFKKTIWSFYNLQKSKLPFYFSRILQSGVYHQLHRIQVLKDHLRRRYVTTERINRTQKPQILDMTSAVQTVFILFALMSLLAKFAFAAELGYASCPKLLQKIRHMNCKIVIVTSVRQINILTNLYIRRNIFTMKYKL